MTLADYRRSRGLTLVQVAEELGLRSKGTLSDIERGVQSASPSLALSIESWSNGAVNAGLLSPVVAEIRKAAA